MGLFSPDGLHRFYTSEQISDIPIDVDRAVRSACSDATVDFERFKLSQQFSDYLIGFLASFDPLFATKAGSGGAPCYPFGWVGQLGIVIAKKMGFSERGAEGIAGDYSRTDTVACQPGATYVLGLADGCLYLRRVGRPLKAHWEAADGAFIPFSELRKYLKGSPCLTSGEYY